MPRPRDGQPLAIEAGYEMNGNRSAEKMFMTGVASGCQENCRGFRFTAQNLIPSKREKHLPAEVYSSVRGRRCWVAKRLRRPMHLFSRRNGVKRIFARLSNCPRRLILWN